MGGGGRGGLGGGEGGGGRGEGGGGEGAGGGRGKGGGGRRRGGREGRGRGKGRGGEGRRGGGEGEGERGGGMGEGGGEGGGGGGGERGGEGGGGGEGRGWRRGEREREDPGERGGGIWRERGEVGGEELAMWVTVTSPALLPPALILGRQTCAVRRVSTPVATLARCPGAAPAARAVWQESVDALSEPLRTRGTGWTSGTKTEWDRLVGCFHRSWRCRSRPARRGRNAGEAARGAFQSGPQLGIQLACPPVPPADDTGHSWRSPCNSCNA